MTLKEIAKEVGVSPSTVSRTLNDPETKAASKEMRDRIWEVVRNSGYTPNAHAQGLRRGEHEVTQIQHAKLHYAIIYARGGASKSGFFSELAAAIEYEAYKQNCILKYSLYATDMDERSFEEYIKSSHVDGIVVLGRFETESMRKIAETQQNLVYAGLASGSSKHDVVFCDGYKAAIQGVQHLIDIRHTKIAYVGETQNEWRYHGYCDAMTQAGLPIVPQCVVRTSQTLEEGNQAVEELLRRNVDFSAVFAANDITAMGVISGLRQQGIKVPSEVSVVSVDDIEMARYFTPMLTTIHIPIKELGTQTAKLLVERINKGHTLPLRVELPISLSLRESAAPYQALAQNKQKA